jgi:hypothetical protein
MKEPEADRQLRGVVARSVMDRQVIWNNFSKYVPVMTTSEWVYRISRNNVPDFNKFSHKFDTTQVNTISTDEKENPLRFFQTHYKYSICSG